MSLKFYDLISAKTRKRVPLDELKKAFFEAHPELITRPERFALLLEALQSLAAENRIQFPAKGSWEKVGNPPLPNWVQIVRQERQKQQNDYASMTWVPELGFWTELTPPALDAAAAINKFLLNRRTTLELVPIKERSLEIFGDEKKLDELRSGNTLFGGRLTLADIGAFQVPLPLPYRQACAPGCPVLVVENHNSFWSFGEWNKQAKRYSAVVYGSGHAFRSSGAALKQVLQEVNGIGAEYLGDLDPSGVRIPLEFNRARGESGVAVKPAIEFYRWLVEHGRRREKKNGPEFANVSAHHWLGFELGNQVADIWNKGQWIPQESLGIEALRRHFG